MTIAKLRNLGPQSADMLMLAGIQTREQLEQLGPVPAYLAVKQAGLKPSLNLLWAIAGALTETHWAKLSPEYKQALRDELDEQTSHLLPTKPKKKRIGLPETPGKRG
jgi:hypothetical protein